jgi:hypothetical protein
LGFSSGEKKITNLKELSLSYIKKIFESGDIYMYFVIVIMDKITLQYIKHLLPSFISSRSLTDRNMTVKQALRY